MSEAVVLRGKISDYRVQRGSANFFFTQADQGGLRMAAIGAALVGASGAAMGTAIAASDINEEADQIEFMIDGKRVSGWLWRSPFEERDEVEVVAEREGDSYSVVAIARPADRTIAMYPHLARGRWSHILNSLKWWFFGMTGFSLFFLLFMAFISALDGENLFTASYFKYILAGQGIVVAVMLLPTTHMIFKYMQFVKAAEVVFKALGWKEVGFVDLNKSSRAAKRGNEPPEYGTYYFRY